MIPSQVREKQSLLESSFLCHSECPNYPLGVSIHGYPGASLWGTWRSLTQSSHVLTLQMCRVISAAVLEAITGLASAAESAASLAQKASGHCPAGCMASRSMLDIALRLLMRFLCLSSSHHHKDTGRDEVLRHGTVTEGRCRGHNSE